MIKSQLVSLGARIPADLKKRIAGYCERNGIKLQFFIAEAIREKWDDVKQDNMDNVIVDERLKNPKFSSEKGLVTYIQSRKKNR